jgi:hypothetical protein
MTYLYAVGLLLFISIFVYWGVRLELKKMNDDVKLKKEKMLLRKSLYDRLSKDKKFREEYLKNGLKTIKEFEKDVTGIK